MNMHKMARVGLTMIGSFFLIIAWVCIGYVMVNGLDIGKMMHEHRQKVRIKEMKKAGVWRFEEELHLLIGREFPSSSPGWRWQSSEGRDIPLNRPPRFEDKQWEGFNFPPLPPEAFAASHPPAK